MIGKFSSSVGFRLYVFFWAVFISAACVSVYIYYYKTQDLLQYDTLISSLSQITKTPGEVDEVASGIVRYQRHPSEALRTSIHSSIDDLVATIGTVTSNTDASHERSIHLAEGMMHIIGRMRVLADKVIMKVDAEQFDGELIESVEYVTMVSDAYRSSANRFAIREIMHADDMRESIKRKNAALGALLLIFSLGSLVLAFGFTLVIRRTIIRPIHRLEHAAKRFPKDPASLDLGIQTPDEIGNLTRAFERMGASLRYTQSQLERRNGELVRFAEVAAHHLQEPSRRLVVFSQRLRTRLGREVADEVVSVSLTFIEQEARRLLTLVRDMEVFLAAGQPVGPVERQDTTAVAHELLWELSALIAQSGARIEIGSLPPVMLDRHRLRRLFRIVLENAIHYRHPDRPLHIRMSGEAFPHHVRLRIDDNGIGIAPDYREQVFRAFDRLHPKADETSAGTGLAILRRIAESTGGNAWIEESPEQGVAVIIELGTGLEFDGSDSNSQ